MTATPRPGRVLRAAAVGGVVACVLGACAPADGPSVDAAAVSPAGDTAPDASAVSTAPRASATPTGRPAARRATPGRVEGLVSDTAPRPVRPLERPPRGGTVVDPAFGTRITRISDAGPGGVVKPMYSTMPAWNADESSLVVYATGDRPGQHLLLDGATYEQVRVLDVDPSDLEQLWWHPTDPDVLLYPSGDELRRYSVAADASTTVATFDGCDEVTAGADVHWVSWDGDVVGLVCVTAAGPRLLTYRISSDEEGGRFGGGGELLVAPVPLPSGDASWLGADDGPRIVDADGGTLRELRTVASFEHASIGRDAGGRATRYSVVFDPVGGTGVGAVVATDLRRDTSEVLVGPATGYPYPPSGVHLSAVAHRAPGLVAVSVVGTTEPGEQDTLDQELLLVDTARDEVLRVGHHRSHGRGGPLGYWAEPHVTISPTGTRLLFGSDWGGGDRVDAYVVDLRVAPPGGAAP